MGVRVYMCAYSVLHTCLFSSVAFVLTMGYLGASLVIRLPLALAVPRGGWRRAELDSVAFSPVSHLV